ncbi:hypothetical protein HYZ80_02765 [Candidatus Parcubacteria bacterium]|nr:hypothetical protein [Candidatus Parcubacteria bacterium]
MIRIKRPPKGKKRDSLTKRLFAAGAAGVTMFTGGVLGVRAAGTVKPPFAQVRLRTDRVSGAGRTPGEAGAGTKISTEEEARIKAETGRFLGELRKVAGETDSQSFFARVLNISPAEAGSDLNAAIQDLYNSGNLTQAVQSVLASGAYTPDQAAAALREAETAGVIPAGTTLDIAVNLGATPEQAAAYAQPSYVPSSEADVYVPPPAAAVLPAAPVAPIIPPPAVESGPPVLPSVPAAARTPEVPPLPPPVIRIDEERGIGHVAMPAAPVVPVAREEPTPTPERTVQTEGGTFIVTPGGAVLDANRNPTPYSVDAGGQVSYQGTPVGRLEFQQPGIEEMPREVFIPTPPPAPPVQAPGPVIIVPPGESIVVPEGESRFVLTPDIKQAIQDIYQNEGLDSLTKAVGVQINKGVVSPADAAQALQAAGIPVADIAYIARNLGATPEQIAALVPSAPPPPAKLEEPTLPPPSAAPLPRGAEPSAPPVEIGPPVWQITHPTVPGLTVDVDADGNFRLPVDSGLGEFSGAFGQVNKGTLTYTVRSTSGTEQSGDLRAEGWLIAAVTPASPAKPAAPAPALPTPAPVFTLHIGDKTFQIDPETLIVTKPESDPNQYVLYPAGTPGQYIITVNGVSTFRLDTATGNLTQFTPAGETKPIGRFTPGGAAGPGNTFTFTPNPPATTTPTSTSPVSFPGATPTTTVPVIPRPVPPGVIGPSQPHELWTNVVIDNQRYNLYQDGAVNAVDAAGGEVATPYVIHYNENAQKYELWRAANHGETVFAILNPSGQLEQTFHLFFSPGPFGTTLRVNDRPYRINADGTVLNPPGDTQRYFMDVRGNIHLNDQYGPFLYLILVDGTVRDAQHRTVGRVEPSGTFVPTPGSVGAPVPALPTPAPVFTLHIGDKTFQIDPETLIVTKPESDPNQYMLYPAGTPGQYIITVNGVSTFRLDTTNGNLTQFTPAGETKPIGRFTPDGAVGPGTTFTFTPSPVATTTPTSTAPISPASTPAQPAAGPATVPPAAEAAPSVPAATPALPEVRVRINDAIYRIMPDGTVVSPPSDPNTYSVTRNPDGTAAISREGQVMYTVNAQGEVRTPDNQTVGQFDVPKAEVVTDYTAGRVDYYLRKAEKVGQTDAATIRELADSGVSPTVIAERALKEWGGDARRVAVAAAEAGAAPHLIAEVLKTKELKVQNPDGTSRTVDAFTLALEQAVGQVAAVPESNQRLQGMGSIADFLRRAGISAQEARDRLKAAGFTDDPTSILSAVGYSAEGLATTFPVTPTQIRAVNVDGTWLALSPDGTVYIPQAGSAAELKVIDGETRILFKDRTGRIVPLPIARIEQVSDVDLLRLAQAKFQAQGLTRPQANERIFPLAVAAGWSDPGRVIRAALEAGFSPTDIVSGLASIDSARRENNQESHYLEEGIMAALDAARSPEARQATADTIIAALRESDLGRERLDELIQYLAPRLNVPESQLREQLGVNQPLYKAAFRLELDLPRYLPESLRQSQKVFTGRSLRVISQVPIHEYAATLTSVSTGQQTAPAVTRKSSHVIKIAIPAELRADQYQLTITIDGQAQTFPIEVERPLQKAQAPVEVVPLTSVEQAAIAFRTTLCTNCASEGVFSGDPNDANKLIHISNTRDLVRSTDGGRSWHALSIDNAAQYPRAQVLYVGDPKVVSLPDGSFIITSLGSDHNKNFTLGGLIYRGTYTGGLNATFFQDIPSNLPANQDIVVDRPILAVDQRNSAVYIAVNGAWFGERGESDFEHAIYFSQDGGQTFKKGRIGHGLAIHSMTVGADGTLYAARLGEPHELFRFSSLDPVRYEVLPLPGRHQTWEGSVRISTTSRRAWVGYEGPEVIADTSPTSPHQGRLYAVWSQSERVVDDQNFEYKHYGFNHDVFVSYSDDRGVSWSPPAKVNDDIGSGDQVFPSARLDTNGALHVAFFDHRNNQSDAVFDVYYAKSTDGVNFSKNLRLNEEPIPNEYGGRFLGDYIDMVMPYPDRVYVAYPDAPLFANGKRSTMATAVKFVEISQAALAPLMPSRGAFSLDRWRTAGERIETLHSLLVSGWTPAEIIRALAAVDASAKAAGRETHYLEEGIMAALEAAPNPEARQATADTIIAALGEAGLSREQTQELIRNLAPRLNMTEEQLRSALGIGQLARQTSRLTRQMTRQTRPTVPRATLVKVDEPEFAKQELVLPPTLLPAPNSRDVQGFLGSASSEVAFQLVSLIRDRFQLGASASRRGSVELGDEVTITLQVKGQDVPPDKLVTFDALVPSKFRYVSGSLVVNNVPSSDPEFILRTPFATVVDEETQVLRLEHGVWSYGNTTRTYRFRMRADTIGRPGNLDVKAYLDVGPQLAQIAGVGPFTTSVRTSGPRREAQQTTERNDEFSGYAFDQTFSGGRTLGEAPLPGRAGELVPGEANQFMPAQAIELSPHERNTISVRYHFTKRSPDAANTLRLKYTVELPGEVEYLWRSARIDGALIDTEPLRTLPEERTPAGTRLVTIVDRETPVDERPHELSFQIFTAAAPETQARAPLVTQLWVNDKLVRKDRWEPIIIRAAQPAPPRDAAPAPGAPSAPPISEPPSPPTNWEPRYVRFDSSLEFSRREVRAGERVDITARLERIDSGGPIENFQYLLELSPGLRFVADQGVSVDSTQRLEPEVSERNGIQRVRVRMRFPAGSTRATGDVSAGFGDRPTTSIRFTAQAAADVSPGEKLLVGKFSGDGLQLGLDAANVLVRAPEVQPRFTGEMFTIPAAEARPGEALAVQIRLFRTDAAGRVGDVVYELEVPAGFEYVTESGGASIDGRSLAVTVVSRTDGAQVVRTDSFFSPGGNNSQAITVFLRAKSDVPAGEKTFVGRISVRNRQVLEQRTSVQVPELATVRIDPFLFFYGRATVGDEFTVYADLGRRDTGGPIPQVDYRLQLPRGFEFLPNRSDVYFWDTGRSQPLNAGVSDGVVTATIANFPAGPGGRTIRFRLRATDTVIPGEHTLRGEISAAGRALGSASATLTVRAAPEVRFDSSLALSQLEVENGQSFELTASLTRVDDGGPVERAEYNLQVPEGFVLAQVPDAITFRGATVLIDSTSSPENGLLVVRLENIPARQQSFGTPVVANILRFKLQAVGAAPGAQQFSGTLFALEPTRRELSTASASINVRQPLPQISDGVLQLTEGIVEADRVFRVITRFRRIDRSDDIEHFGYELRLPQGFRLVPAQEGGGAELDGQQVAVTVSSTTPDGVQIMRLEIERLTQAGAEHRLRFTLRAPSEEGQYSLDGGFFVGTSPVFSSSTVGFEVLQSVANVRFRNRLEASSDRVANDQVFAITAQLTREDAGDTIRRARYRLYFPYGSRFVGGPEGVTFNGMPIEPRFITTYSSLGSYYIDVDLSGYPTGAGVTSPLVFQVKAPPALIVGTQQFFGSLVLNNDTNRAYQADPLNITVVPAQSAGPQLRPYVSGPWSAVAAGDQFYLDVNLQRLDDGDVIRNFEYAIHLPRGFEYAPFVLQGGREDRTVGFGDQSVPVEVVTDQSGTQVLKIRVDYPAGITSRAFGVPLRATADVQTGTATVLITFSAEGRELARAETAINVEQAPVEIAFEPRDLFLWGAVSYPNTHEARPDLESFVYAPLVRLDTGGPIQNFEYRLVLPAGFAYAPGEDSVWFDGARVRAEAIDVSTDIAGRQTVTVRLEYPASRRRERGVQVKIRSTAEIAPGQKAFAGQAVVDGRVLEPQFTATVNLVPAGPNSGGAGFFDSPQPMG